MRDRQWQAVQSIGEKHVWGEQVFERQARPSAVLAAQNEQTPRPDAGQQVADNDPLVELRSECRSTEALCVSTWSRRESSEHCSTRVMRLSSTLTSTGALTSPTIWILAVPGAVGKRTANGIKPKRGKSSIRTVPVAASRSISSGVLRNRPTADRFSRDASWSHDAPSAASGGVHPIASYRASSNWQESCYRLAPWRPM